MQPLTPVVIHQNTPVAVEIWRTIPQHVLAVLMAIVVFVHFISCVVFLIFMYNIYSALDELQKNLQQVGF